MSPFARRWFAVLAAAVLLVPPSLAFYAPLSEQAVREAYFLGHRHDGSFGLLLGKYIKQLPRPKTGPYISFVAFLTPFIQIVQYSDRSIGNYSAQQAELEHQRQPEEIVQIFVEIQLTESYGRLIPGSPGSASNAPNTPALRPHDFWKDFQVRVYNGDEWLAPLASHSHANSGCGRRGPCVLTGATLELEFPATAFASYTATIEVTPPEGDVVSVDFDLSSLR